MPAQAWRSTFTALVGLALWLAPGADTVAANPAAADCADAVTQSDMARCAHDEFLAANQIYAQRHAALQVGLSSAQRNRLRQMEQGWIGYRTAACRFESGSVQSGSARSQRYWRCAARMTLDQAEALDRLARCAEGDLTCDRPTR